MFIQVIQGKLKDEQRAKMLMNRWTTELAPNAIGWLGGTYGITDDGMLVAVMRFESTQEAQRNSARPEQDAWWAEMAQCFDGAATFHDCDNAMMILAGGSDDAGFVQVIQGHVKDRTRLQALAEQTVPMLREHRPDIIGATIAIDESGFFTETVAFTNEAAARENEKKAMPPDAEQMMQEEMAQLEDVTYLDLHHPWFASTR